MTFYLLSILTLCMVFAESTNGLNCFQCGFFSVVHEDFISNKTCAYGKTPHPELSVDCSQLDYTMLPHQEEVALDDFLQFPMSGSSQRVLPYPNATFSCITMTFDGKYIEDYGGQQVFGVQRGCLMSIQNQTTEKQCREGQMNDLRATLGEGDISQFLENFSIVDENVTYANVCTCNEDNCNSSGSRLASGFAIVLLFTTFFGIMSNTG